MQPDEKKAVRLGWIAIDVLLDADRKPVDAEVAVHGEKGSSPHGAMVFAQVAKAAHLELHRLVLGDPDAPQHAATCANEDSAEACGCCGATSASAPAVPGLDPLTIMEMARGRVFAHGGSFLETVRDLIDAHAELRKALSPSDSGRPQK